MKGKNEIANDGVMPSPAEMITKGTTMTRFTDGAMSGLLSGIMLQPLQVIKTSMQISPIDKPTDHHHQSKAFQKVMSKTKHKHYELLSFKEATLLIY